MNRSKQPLLSRLRKQMTKAIKGARSLFLSKETRAYQDEQTAKELRKKFPQKKRSRKKEALAQALKTKQEKKQLLLERVAPHVSKRTSPHMGIEESAPASPHKEGARWIKNLNNKMVTQRAIQSHHGAPKR